MNNKLQKTQANRRRQLINKLRQVTPDRFNLSCFRNHCQTTACVVGHLPDFFSGHWAWTSNTSFDAPRLKNNGGHRSVVAELSDFFGGTESGWDKVIYDTYYPYGQKNNLQMVVERLHAYHLSLLVADRTPLQLAS